MSTIIYYHHTVRTIILPDEVAEFPLKRGLPSFRRNLEVVGLELELVREEIPQGVHLHPVELVNELILRELSANLRLFTLQVIILPSEKEARDSFVARLAVSVMAIEGFVKGNASFFILLLPWGFVALMRWGSFDVQTKPGVRLLGRHGFFRSGSHNRKSASPKPARNRANKPQSNYHA